MRLTMFTDFGLRVLMRLAGQPDRLFTSEQIADEFALSRHHLQKVVRALAEGGFVATVRGAGGGFKLAKDARTITVGSVIRRLEQGQPMVECFRDDGGNCVLTPRCKLKRHLAEAEKRYLDYLETVALADCAYAPPNSGKRLRTAR
jgi:Rrf2 family transcriptional regulator, nitric oxide-sensitive transcriptional repressor